MTKCQHDNLPATFLLAGVFSFDWFTSLRKFDSAHVDDSVESFLFSMLCRQHTLNIDVSFSISTENNTT